MLFYLLTIYSGAVIGFCQETAPLGRLPGWDDSSWGYHGDSGELFHSYDYRGRTYAEGFGKNDVVGCCVMPEERTAHFTRNGKRLRMSRSLPFSLSLYCVCWIWYALISCGNIDHSSVSPSSYMVCALILRCFSIYSTCIWRSPYSWSSVPMCRVGGYRSTCSGTFWQASIQLWWRWCGWTSGERPWNLVFAVNKSYVRI